MRKLSSRSVVRFCLKVFLSFFTIIYLLLVITSVLLVNMRIIMSIYNDGFIRNYVYLIDISLLLLIIMSISVVYFTGIYVCSIRNYVYIPGNYIYLIGKYMSLVIMFVLKVVTSILLLTMPILLVITFSYCSLYLFLGIIRGAFH